MRLRAEELYSNKPVGEHRVRDRKYGSARGVCDWKVPEDAWERAAARIREIDPRGGNRSLALLSELGYLV